MHVYFAHHCFFLPLLHVPVGIQNATATSEKQKTLACIREIQVHKLWTKVYSQKGLTAMGCSNTTGLKSDSEPPNRGRPLWWLCPEGTHLRTKKKKYSGLNPLSAVLAGPSLENE